MQISDAGKDLLKELEGLKLEAYKCSAGVWTIGYGHTAGVKEGMTITEAQADKYLTDDLKNIEYTITADLKNKKFTRHQFDALVMFTFNVGLGNYKKSTLRKKFLAGDFDGASDEFLKWNKYKNPKTGEYEELAGLTNRRRKEQDWFDTDDED